MLTFSFPVRTTLTQLQERVSPSAFSSLVHFQKNKSVTAHDKEQILNILATLLVQGDPHITLSISRIFRPLLIDLVARVVRGKIQDGSDHLKQFTSISLSFSLILPMAPHILGFVLEYFNKSSSIFDKLLSKNVEFSSYSNTDETWLSMVQTCYRLFRFSPKIFGKLWNFSPLFSMLHHPNPRVRWYVVASLQLVMDLSDANVTPLRQSVETVHQQLSLCEAEFLALETAIMFMDSQSLAEKDAITPPEVIVLDEEDDPKKENTKEDQYFTKDDLCDALVDVCGILLPKRATEKPVAESRLVYTTTSQQNMKALALAVCQGAPILLEGMTGSGKTSLIDELALITSCTNIIKIHLGDQADAKVLLGTYVCTEIPGEFRWQQGALTQAVSEGRWIVIEDIDLAPMEVLSVLIPLLETRKLFIPGRGEVIDAAPGFQLFATQTLFGSTLSSRDQAGRIAHHLWTRVVVEPLTSAELTTVLSTHFPEVKNLVPKMIETFNLLTQAMSGIVDEKSGMKQLVISGSRFFSTRDLVKWVQRIHLLDRTAVERETSAAREQIFMEAVDCFCCMIPKKDIREKLIHVIARVWNVWDERTDYYLKYKPDINKVGNEFTVGRVEIKIEEKDGLYTHANTKFAHTGHTLRLLERIAACVRLNEPALLVGDTGTGKTSTIQYIADMLQQKLIVLNLNQQSDSSDLLGGFKPIEMRTICTPLKENFEKLFKKTFSEQKNTEFLTKVASAYAAKNWGQFLTLLRKAVQFFEKKVAETDSKSNGKSMRPKLREMWKIFSTSVSKFAIQYEQAKNSFSFSFVEGSLVKAVREGYWVLLDEINLATTETLESLSGLLEGGSLTLNERGDVEPIARHPSFRVFGCMNPPTDIGKKDLPPGIRNRFTEFFVDEMDNPEDLKVIVMAYLKDIAASPPVIEVVDFYLAAKELAASKLTDGANQKPHYSLRTLSRALEYSRMIVAHYGLQRALFEGISMSFLTQLNRQSYPEMLELIKKHLAKKGVDKTWTKPPVCPGPQFIPFANFWIEAGDQPVQEPAHYILTESIKSSLANLARILVSRKYPILLQGPTSSGKTSMVEYLAKRTGHRFVRINNHEHTDLQEYLGTYISDTNGKLVFQEGILVEAVRKGYWVVLDELNLAPSEVLEALNRLLDDNRELYIPETQEVVRPHPHFMLFATQNPPGLYGGRKILSRAFRNRFLELHIDDIPDHELEEILSKRCSIPPSYCKKLVLIMKDLQMNRQGTGNVFGGKQGYITLRDLFRWAERRPSSMEELAVEGYMLLAERLRRDQDKDVIKQILKTHLKVDVKPESIYACEKSAEFQQALLACDPTNERSREYLTGIGQIVWTKSMKRLYTLVGRCLQHKEPVLLVGETGSSKTTICQVFAAALERKLGILNCHQHTETADFLGGLRPVRGKEHIATQISSLIAQFAAKSAAPNAQRVASSIGEMKETKEMVETFEALCKEEPKLEDKKKPSKSQAARAEFLAHTAKEIRTLYSTYCSLFTWYDGPLVQAMKNGELFLIDEISLAEDAVLERLNSVLEPNRLLVLAEKGGVEIEELVAHEDCRIMATMNPGGDFGKKELSPAMRNRFTEIWVPSISSHEDLQQIIEEKFKSPSLAGYSKPMLEFVEWFLSVQRGRRIVSLRDILSWVGFMNETVVKDTLPAPIAFVHGACLVLLDGLGVGSSAANEHLARKLKVSCLQKLIEFIPQSQQSYAREVFVDSTQYTLTATAKSAFGIAPFFINIGPAPVNGIQFSLEAPTTSNNVMRVLRAMQLPRAILLEGSPGVGKTSLVTALAAASGHRVVRINLSEQTDIMDLLGSDLPKEGGKGGEFAWRDGVFLQALNNGDWVLLDELNLASQSVLEGLNSCLDHRTTVYIPELQREFHCHPNFRVFAAQNPTHQGGGRKGLPKSFLNRFTQVFVDKLQDSDLLFISRNLYPQIDPTLLAKMIEFISQMHHETMVTYKFGRKGSPWEFNLRDMFRWCDLIVNGTSQVLAVKPAPAIDHLGYVDLIFLQRMRTVEDREHVKRLFNCIFGVHSFPNSEVPPFYHVTPNYFQVGYSILPRKQATIPSQSDVDLLPGMLVPLSHLMKCVEMQWMCILNGPTASGKTSLVRALAQMTGHTLHEFAMNSSVDTTEILGGFEQVDLARHKKRIVDSVSELVALVGHKLMPSSAAKPTQVLPPPAKKTKVSHTNGKTNQSTEYPKVDERSVTALRDLQNIWGMFACRSKFNGSQQDSNATKKNTVFDKEQHDALTQILNLVLKLADDEHFGLGVDERSLVVGINKQITALQEITGHVTGCFEWIDGLLLQALETGAWILIDNVNFCNPTVLDRLNPLLETEGSLMINECGLGQDGTPRVVRPHPNFRIFLAMDDRNGEISRAMRNRGIEICLLEPSVQSRDSLVLLNKAGVPGKQLPQAMIDFHIDVQSKLKSSAQDANTLRHLLQWGRITVSQVQRGTGSLAKAFICGMEQVYVRSQRFPHQRKMISDLFYEHFSKLDIFKSTFLEPGLWPLLVSGANYKSDSITTTIQRQSAVFHSIHQLVQSKSIDSAVLENAEKLAKDPKTENVLRASRELLVQKVSDKTNLSPPLLSLVFLGTSTLADVSKEGLQDKTPLIAKYAVRYIVESSSFTDWATRTKWLSANVTLSGLPSGSNLSNANLQLEIFGEMARQVLTQIHKHPIMQITRDLLTKLSQTLGLDPTLFDTQPYDIRPNTTLLSYLAMRVKSHVQEESPGLSTHLTYDWLVYLYEVVDLEISRQFQAFYELQVYSQGEKVQGKTKRTCAQVIYAFYKRALDKRDLGHEVLALLYPFFKAFDECMDSWLTVTRNFSESEKKPLPELKPLILMRNKLWDSLHSTTVFLISDFIIRWRWMIKELGKVAKIGVVLHEHLTNIITKISTTVIGNQSNLKNALWKWGGHPQVLKSPELISLEGELLAIGKSVESPLVVTEVDPKMYADVEWKKSLIEALATLHFANVQSKQTSDQILKSISAVPQYLQYKLHSLKDAHTVQNLQATPCQADGETEEEEEVSKPSRTLHPAYQAQHTRVGVWPLWDHTSVKKEGCVISRIVQLLHPDHHDPSSSVLSDTATTTMREMLQDLKSFITMSLNRSSRTPVDLVPYQHLTWIFEGDASRAGAELPSLVHAMWFVFYTRCWKNTFNIAGKLAHIPNVEKVQGGYETLMAEADTGEGPARLFHDTQTAFSFYLLNDWQNLVISTVPQKIEQLGLLSSHLSTLDLVNTSKSEWNHLAALFCQTIGCFWKSFPPAQYTALRGVLSDLYTAWVSNGDFAKSTQELSVILPTSNDERFVKLSKRLLYPCLDLISKQANRDNHSGHARFELGKAWLLLGLFRLNLLVPVHPVDPTAKYAVHRTYVEEQIAELQSEIEARQRIEQVFTGKATNATILVLVEQLSSLVTEKQALSEKVTFRTAPHQFESLYKEVVDFCSNFTEFAKLAELLEKMDPASKSDDWWSVTSQESMWQDQTSFFIRTINEKHSQFRDVLHPIIIAIYQVKHGLRIAAEAANQIKEVRELASRVTAVPEPHKFLMNLIDSLTRYPTHAHKGESMFPFITGKTLFDIESVLLQCPNVQATKSPHKTVGDVSSLVLRYCLCRAYVENFGRGHLDNKAMESTLSLFGVVVSEWKAREEARKRKEEADAMTVKYKVKSHSMDTQEEIDEAKFRATFPDYFKMYSDLDENGDDATLPESAREAKEAKEQKEAEENDLKRAQALSDAELFQLCAIHRLVFSHLDGIPLPVPQTQAAKFPSIMESDRKATFELSYSAANLMLRALGYRSSLHLDQTALGGHILAANTLYERLMTKPVATAKAGKKKIKSKTQAAPPVLISLTSGTSIFRGMEYDVYHDSNVSEVSLLREPLQQFKNRLRTIQIEHMEVSGNENLLILERIIDRLLDQPATSPLFQVLVGVELLLRKAQLWEDVAAKHVSIKDHMDTISRLITRWRRLEIESWPSILKSKEQCHELNALKWWFHLYGIINESSGGETELDDKKKLEEIFKSLEEFISASNFGEFPTRLNLIAAFANEVKAQVRANINPVKSSVTFRTQLANMLENVHQYYMQFMPEFNKTVTNLREPIIKQLQDQMKLQKWEKTNLIDNYYRLKEFTEKSHRTIIKLSKSYEEILLKPFVKLLMKMEPTVEPRDEIQKQKDDIISVSPSILTWQNVPYNQFLSPTSMSWYFTDHTTVPDHVKSLLKLGEAQQHRNLLQARFATMRSLYEKDFFGAHAQKPVREGVEAIDVMSGTIIERAAQLENDEKVNKKEKAFALSQLLAKLSSVGLSFRPSAYSQEQKKFAYVFQQINPNPTVHSTGVTLWQRSREYYYRVLSRLHKMRQSAQTFNSDLNKRIVDKASGFAEHVFSIATKQRTFIQEHSQGIVAISDFSYIFSFGEAKKGSNIVSLLPAQASTRDWVKKQKKLLEVISDIFHELQLLLSCIPNNSELHQVSSTFSQASRKIDNCKLRVHELLAKYRLTFGELFASPDSFPICTASVQSLLKSNFVEIKQVSSWLTEIYDKVPYALQHSFKCITEESAELSHQFEEYQQSVENHTTTSVTTFSEEFVKQYDQVVEHMLIAFQELRNRINKIPRTDRDAEAEAEEKKLFDALDEGNIMELQQYFGNCFSYIATPTFATKLVSLHKLLLQYGDTCDRKSEDDRLVLQYAQQMLRSLHPLLHQFCNVANRLLVDYIAFHKSVEKLGYVITGVFNTLFTKGFCKKEEGEPEEGDEGEMGSGTGMGEGKGEKDISDQIDDDEDLLGRKEEKQDKDKDEEEEDDQERKEDEGVETQADFEGEMKDIEEEEDDDEKKDEDEEESDDDLDKEMGEIDQKKENVVDEKIWGDDEEDQPSEQEKMEDAPGQGEPDEDDLANKKDDETETPDKNDKNKDKEEKEQQNEKSDEKDGAGDSDEEKQESDGEVDEFEEHGDGEDDEGKVNEQLSDMEEEDHHMDPSKDEEFEVPEDLNFGEDENEEQEEPPPDQMDIDEEKESEEEVGAEEEDDKKVDEFPEIDEDKTEDKKDEEGKEKEPENKLDNQANTEEEGEKPKEEENKESINKNEEEEDGSKAEERPLGVKDTMGKLSDVNLDQMEDENAKDEEAQASEQGQALPVPSAQQEGEFQEALQQQTDESEPTPNRPDANPYRSLGDAKKEWQKRLNVQDNKDKKESKHPEQKIKESAEDLKDQQFDFMNDDKEKEDAQTLGPATEEQLQDVEMTDAEGKEDVDAPQETIHHGEDEKEEEEKDAVNANQKMKLKMPDEKKKKEEVKEIEKPAETKTEGPHDEEVIPTSVKTGMDLDKDEEEQAEDGTEKLLTKEDVDHMRQELDEYMHKWKEEPGNMEYGQELWRKYEALTSDLAADLCEQLRLILEPTLATKLQGDYRTGKRINMKKVIPYIASQFKKDKIWLRRTKPNKRQYQVMVAIDDTASMTENKSGQMALEALTMICKAMSRLEVGQLAVAKFGKDMNLLHPFETPFTDREGPQIITQFPFSQDSTNMATFLAKTVQILQMSKMRAEQGAMQLVFIISDGFVLMREPENTRKWLREASANNIFIVFIVIDNPDKETSILKTDSVEFVDGKLVKRSYMTEFPFPFYVILRDLPSLPQILADTVRQWFEMVKQIQ